MDITRREGWTAVYMPFTDLTSWQHRVLGFMWTDYQAQHSPPNAPRRLPPDMGGRTGINLVLPTSEEHLALGMIHKAKETPEPAAQEEPAAEGGDK